MTKHQQILQKVIPDLKQSQELVLRWKNEGEKVVFTNGCFDILHLGHITYLSKAADLGTKLIVALNTDSSVKAQNKSPERPINPEHARLLVLASLQFVDAVFLFNNNTPIEEIKALKPDVLVKGADYDPLETDSSKKTYIVGSKEVKSLGGEVCVIDLVDGFSTTAILKKNNHS